MVAGLLQALERVLLLHPALVFLLVFLLPIALAYWCFALLPYYRGRTEDLLSPWHVRRPAVPGVLEQYGTWEWVKESQLTPFGAWVYQQLAHQHLSLKELATQAHIELDVLVFLLYADAQQSTDPAMIRAIATVLGAGEYQIAHLDRLEVAADAELNS